MWRKQSELTRYSSEWESLRDAQPLLLVPLSQEQREGHSWEVRDVFDLGSFGLLAVGVELGRLDD